MRVMPTTFFDPRKLEVAEHLDLGVQFLKINHFVEAIIEFDEVLRVDPTNFYARWNKCWSLLALGDYTKGMPEHDSAWNGNREDYGLKLPDWKGERCRLLVYENMGFGDAILTMRFLPEIVRRCESVTLVVKKELVRLMMWPGACVLDHVPEDVSNYDAKVSLFNSAHVMGYTRETIPNKPYVYRKFEFNGGKKMGIAWSGTTRKEFTLTSFWSRLDTRGYELFALQKGNDVPADIIPLECNNFSETADLMATLDTIVTIDTAAANLAGAIGHPNAHVVMPFSRDWRWYHKDVWYPSIKIYPQNDPDDWLVPFKRINEAIHDKGNLT